VIFLFSFSSYLISFPLGIALGNLFRGVPINENGNFFLLLWTYFLPGIDAGIVDISTLLFGFLSSVFFALHGSLFLNMKMSHALQKNVNGLQVAFFYYYPY
jgi:cytochrome d ubiquinol oxidase subunit II